MNLCGPAMQPKSKRVRQSLEAAAKGREALKKARIDFETESSETVPTTTGSASEMHVEILPISMASSSHVAVQTKSWKSLLRAGFRPWTKRTRRV